MLVGPTPASHEPSLTSPIELRQIDLPSFLCERLRLAQRVRVELVHSQNYRSIAVALELISPCRQPSGLSARAALPGEPFNDVGAREHHGFLGGPIARSMAPLRHAICTV